MNKLYLFVFASLLACLPSFAQNTFPASGNVGIGTTSPTMPLDINGNIVLRNYSNVTGGGSSIYFTSYGDNTMPGARIRTSLIFAQGSNSVSKLVLSSYNVGYPDEMTLYGGNVGIGTSNPDARLAVNGTIHTKEVKVDVNGWADYVFQSNYQLPSLREVKAYIDKNQHLPEMPSEKQVVKEGINLGEMNKLLTKKVEELTLYLIEMKEEIGELKKQQASK